MSEETLEKQEAVEISEDTETVEKEKRSLWVLEYLQEVQLFQEPSALPPVLQVQHSKPQSDFLFLHF